MLQMVRRDKSVLLHGLWMVRSEIRVIYCMHLGRVDRSQQLVASDDVPNPALSSVPLPCPLRTLPLPNVSQTMGGD